MGENGSLAVMSWWSFFVASNFCFVVVGFFFGEIRCQAGSYFLVCLKFGICKKSEEIGSEIGHAQVNSVRVD